MQLVLLLADAGFFGTELVSMAMTIMRLKMNMVIMSGKPNGPQRAPAAASGVQSGLPDNLLTTVNDLIQRL